jgi:hypothetical protein
MRSKMTIDKLHIALGKYEKCVNSSQSIEQLHTTERYLENMIRLYDLDIVNTELLYTHIDKKKSLMM